MASSCDRAEAHAMGAENDVQRLLLELGGVCLEVRLMMVVPNCADFARVL